MSQAPKPSEVLVVSALTRVRWVAGRVEICAAGAVARVLTVGLDALAVLHAFAHPHTVREVQAALSGFRPDDLFAVVAQLWSIGVLVSPSANDTIKDSSWDAEALAFHRRSRAAGRDAGVPPVSLAVRPLRSDGAIRLERRPRVSGSDLPALLDARTSRRSWGTGPVPAELFGEFLWLSARNRTSEGVVASRPYPSGGAAYSLELYPVLAEQAVAGVDAGVYRYCPASHALEKIATEHQGAVLREAALALDSEPPPMAILATSRFERVSSSYGDLAYSLVLAEVGGLIQTMYLVAEYLGLAACAVGGGPLDDLVGAVIGASDLVEPVVGEMVLGPRGA